MTKIGRHCFISGIVQGVFYRQKTKEQAALRQITGWVKNLPDGRVETLLIGEEEAVLTMLEWLATGPARAVVTSLEVFEAGDVNVEEYKNFKIIYDDD